MGGGNGVRCEIRAAIVIELATKHKWLGKPLARIHPPKGQTNLDERGVVDGGAAGPEPLSSVAGQHRERGEHPVAEAAPEERRCLERRKPGPVRAAQRDRPDPCPEAIGLVIACAIGFASINQQGTLI